MICFVAYNYFAARLRTITAETEQAATKLMNALTEMHHQERAAHNHAGERSARRAGPWSSSDGASLSAPRSRSSR